MAAIGRFYIVECFRFSVCIKYGAGNLVKDKGFLCLLLIIPCIFDEGRLVDQEIFCFLLNSRGNLVDKAKYSLLQA